MSHSLVNKYVRLFFPNIEFIDIKASNCQHAYQEYIILSPVNLGMSSGIFAGFFCRMAAPISTSWALVDSAGPAVFEDLPSGTSLFIVILTCFNDLSNSVKTEVFIKMWRYVAVLRHCREYVKPCFVALKFSDGVWCYTFGFSIRFFEQYGHKKRHCFIRFAVSHFGQYTTNIASWD